MKQISASVLCMSLMFLLPSLLVAQDRRDQFKQLDKNNDGTLTKDELPAQAARRFEQMDADGNGAVTRAEMDAMRKGRDSSSEPEPNASKDAATKGRVKANGEYYAPPAMVERVDSKLKIGDPAPDFSLRISGGEDKITLSQFKGKKPVVLVFGSITCSPFRQAVIQTFDLHKQFGDKAEFLMVYIREAHPESTIVFEQDGVSELKKFTQTDTLDARLGNAQSCTALLKVPFPMLLDTADNKTLVAYGAWPNRMVVVGKDGRLAWDSGEGPKGFRPDKLGQWLQENL